MELGPIHIDRLLTLNCGVDITRNLAKKLENARQSARHTRVRIESLKEHAAIKGGDLSGTHKTMGQCYTTNGRSRLLAQT